MKKHPTDSAPRESGKPFFARLLEAQELEQASGGTPMHTMKYPSDGDDHGGAAPTKKYPSDSDEIMVTMKYPSDSDERY